MYNTCARIVLLIIACSIEGVVLAQENVVARILNKLSLKAEDTDPRFTLIKESPLDKNTSIVFIALPLQKEEMYIVYNTYLLIVNTNTGEILYEIFEKEAITSDAIQLANIKIDTAPYWVADGTRAIGIRESYEGQSRPNPFGHEVLSLYIPQKNKLIKIADDLVMYEMNGEWDTNCEGTFSKSQSILIMLAEKTNGFKNIKVNTATTETENMMENGECISKDTESKSTYILAFDAQTKLYTAARH
ncbi:PA3715 family protein [Ohtaekwangia koreensis]|uniref:Uncharacterized protein n=1 Tax=Ohtaekwangia koreensis TaxID=688867 RepID=A0A1T5LPJ7_9BACT|nr:hypothetical protein [Ohtaekwangia koreensis]SKC77479.1 hypothetical protein SAMN05660236_3590 [Ohtaekwangia koreensis]